MTKESNHLVRGRLLQDDHKRLSLWFASRIDAMYVVREAFREDILRRRNNN